MQDNIINICFNFFYQINQLYKVYTIVFYFVCLVLLTWADFAWALDLEKQAQVSANIVEVYQNEQPDTVDLNNCVTPNIKIDNDECGLVFDVITESVFDENPDYYLVSQNYE